MYWKGAVRLGLGCINVAGFIAFARDGSCGFAS